MSDSLHAALSKAIEHPLAPGDMSKLVRRAIRTCYPDVRERFASKKLDAARKPRVFIVHVQDRHNVNRLAKARYVLSQGGDVPGLEENSNSDVVSECVRRLLVQHLEDWGLGDPYTAALALPSPVWPPISLVERFDEHVVPADVFALLRRFHSRSDGPNTLPELLRLARATLLSKGSSGGGTSATPSDDDIAEAAIALLRNNEGAWGLG